MMMKGEKTRIGFLSCLGIILLISIPGILKAQQDPMYTQYMFNTQTINPAYAGTWKSLGFQALSRLQWVGIEGAPSTQTFSFQMPIKDYAMGVGLNIINDRIGLEKRLSIFADYSYKLKLNSTTDIWLGIKGGFSNYSHNLSEHVLYPDGIEDPAFTPDIKNLFMPNAGVGFLLQNPRYYIGVSTPKLISTRYTNDGTNFAIYGEVTHFFLIAGYVYPIDQDIKFKPTFLVKATKGAPIEVDLSANFLLKDKFWLGATYRAGDSFGFIAQWLIDKNIRIGYAIDISTSKLINFNYCSHEIMVSYELKLLKQEVVSPRYF